MRRSFTFYLALWCAIAGFIVPSAAAETSPTSATSLARLGAYAHISEAVVDELLRRDAKVNEFVVESMLNMTTRGTAKAECHIGIDFVPNPTAANFRLVMSGRAIMDDAVSSTRGVSIYSSSQTQITGYKDILFRPEGLTIGPARATCDTSIQIHDIEANLRIVERLAWRRSEKMHGEAESAAAERAARRAEQQIEAEAGKPLAQLQRQYAQGVDQIAKRGEFPVARLATTNDYLTIRLFSRNAANEADAKHVPRTAARDVSVSIKDAYLNDVLAPLVAGKTITDRQFAEVMLTLTGSTPRPLWVHDREEAWSVRTAAKTPVVAEFSKEHVSIALHVDRVIRGDQTLDGAVAISARFALEATRDGPRFIRQGPVRVDFAAEQGFVNAAQPKSSSDDDLKRFLARKFSGIFLDELYFDGLMPPAGGTWGKLRDLKLTQLTSQNGWFSLGYEK